MAVFMFQLASTHFDTLHHGSSGVWTFLTYSDSLRLPSLSGRSGNLMHPTYAMGCVPKPCHNSGQQNDHGPTRARNSAGWHSQHCIHHSLFIHMLFDSHHFPDVPVTCSTYLCYARLCFDSTASRTSGCIVNYHTISFSFYTTINNALYRSCSSV
jgi:hypothetical protein